MVTTSHIQEGDKLYLVTRRDLSPGYQAVQSCHALRQFTHEHPEVDTEWFTRSNYLALLAVRDERELFELTQTCAEHGLRFSAFREPDIGDRLTAIAIEPGRTSSKLCKKIGLALQS
jgi:hypothetical protein